MRFGSRHSPARFGFSRLVLAPLLRRLLLRIAGCRVLDPRCIRRAYDILRIQGVPLGKRDYLGQLKLKAGNSSQ